MHILIVGGTGFLGSHLRRACAALGHTVHFTGRGPSAEAGHLRCDIARDALVLPEAVDVAYYLAQADSYADFPDTAANIFGVNALGAVKAAVAARNAGCRAFFYASTGNVYAPSFLACDERAPLDRGTPYALSKIHAEEALGLVADARMQVCAFRVFGLFGSTQTSKLAARLLKGVHEGRPVALAPTAAEIAAGRADATGGLTLSWLCVHDAVGQLLALGEAALAGEAPRVMNLAGPRGVSLREFTGAMGKSLGVAPRYVVAQAARTRDFIADVGLAHKLLHPRCTPLDEAMEEFARCADFARIA